MSAATIPTTHEECMRAEPAFKADGTTPKPRIVNLGHGLLLQIVPGQVRPDGTYSVSRSFLYRYSIDSRERRIGLGSVQDITVDLARGKAALLAEEVKAGDDPLETKQAKKAEREARRKAPRKITFREAAIAYCDAHEREWTAKNYRAHWIAVLERHVFPAKGLIEVKRRSCGDS